MDKKGFALIVTMVFLSLLLMGGSSYLYMTTSESKGTMKQIDTEKAFFLANSGIEKAVWRIKNNNLVSPDTFRLKGSGTALNYLEDTDITVTITPLGSYIYQAASTATVGNSTKTLNALVQKNAPAEVFDYGYFVNNWGWYYGNGIIEKGDVRSNGRFDFRDNPYVDGQIYAGFEIDDGGQGIRGSGGAVDGNGNHPNQHPFSDKLDMPNLNDLSYYENKAKTKGGSIVVNGVTIVDKVFGDDSGESGNIVLVGTSSKPIQVNEKDDYSEVGALTIEISGSEKNRASLILLPTSLLDETSRLDLVFKIVHELQHVIDNTKGIKKDTLKTYLKADQRAFNRVRQLKMKIGINPDYNDVFTSFEDDYIRDYEQFKAMVK